MIMTTNLRVAFPALLGAASVSAQVFGTPVDVPLPPSFVMAAALVQGDVNEDGAPDLVLTQIGQYLVLPGDGLGGFGPATANQDVVFDSLGIGGQLRHALLGPATAYSYPPVDVLLVSRLHLLDWNGDGHLDLLVGHMQGATVLFGDGTGGFANGSTLPDVRPNFAFADVNSDGRPDFLGLRISDVPVVSLGDGSGAWTGLLDIGPTVVGGGLVLAGDVDRDGDVDMVVQSQLSTSITTMLGDGAGGFGPPWTTPTSTAALVSHAALVDVNQDRFPDVVAAAAAGPPVGIRIALGDGTGQFAAPTVLPPPGVNPLGFADVDADGHLDIVAGNSTSLVVYPGTAAGTFAAPFATAANNPFRLVVADFDRDGRVDVAAAGATLQSFRNVLPTPTGIAAYGSGTAACGGTIGAWGTPEPALGETAFRVACSNAPRDTVGLLAMGTRVTNGWDPLGLLLTWHLGFAFPVAVMRSDAGGAASAGLPIPDVWWLAGLTVHVQSFWLADPGLGDTCSPALYELASSRGLSITLQP